MCGSVTHSGYEIRFHGSITANQEYLDRYWNGDHFEHQFTDLPIDRAPFVPILLLYFKDSTSTAQIAEITIEMFNGECECETVRFTHLTFCFVKKTLFQK